MDSTIIFVSSNMNGIGKTITCASLCNFLKANGYTCQIKKLSSILNLSFYSPEKDLFFIGEKDVLHEDFLTFYNIGGYNGKKEDYITLGNVFNNIFQEQSKMFFKGEKIYLTKIEENIKQLLLHDIYSYNYTIVEIEDSIESKEVQMIINALNSLPTKTFSILINHLENIPLSDKVSLFSLENSINILKNSGIGLDVILARSQKEIDLSKIEKNHLKKTFFIPYTNDVFENIKNNMKIFEKIFNNMKLPINIKSFQNKNEKKLKLLIFTEKDKKNWEKYLETVILQESFWVEAGFSCSFLKMDDYNENFDLLKFNGIIFPHWIHESSQENFRKIIKILEIQNIPTLITGNAFSLYLKYKSFPIEISKESIWRDVFQVNNMGENLKTICGTIEAQAIEGSKLFAIYKKTKGKFTTKLKENKFINEKYLKKIESNPNMFFSSYLENTKIPIALEKQNLNFFICTSFIPYINTTLDSPDKIIFSMLKFIKESLEEF